MLFKQAWLSFLGSLQRPGKAVCIFPAEKLSGFLRPAQLTLPVRGWAATRIISGSFIQLWMWCRRENTSVSDFNSSIHPKEKNNLEIFALFPRPDGGSSEDRQFCQCSLAENEWLLLQLGVPTGSLWTRSTETYYHQTCDKFGLWKNSTREWLKPYWYAAQIVTCSV